MNPRALITLFSGFADQLKFKTLFLVVASLFVINLIIPDFIPLIDEIILGLLTLILANWKKEQKNNSNGGNLIEGKITHKE